MNDTPNLPPSAPPAAPPIVAPYAAVPAPPPVAPPRLGHAPGKNPAAAGLLSVFPGLGHVYLGLYKRGLAFFVIWALVFAIVDKGNGGPIGLLIPFWWVFCIIDAVRQARAINATGAPEPGIFGEEKAYKADGGLTFGILLILLGLFFLVDRFVRIDLTFLLDWWPLLLVAFGGWQVWQYLDDRKKRDEAARAAAAEEVGR